MNEKIDLEELNRLTEKIIGAAIEVHRELGPGLLESVYQRCLAIALREAGLNVEEERPVPISFRGQQISADGYRLDMLVDDTVILELKSVAALEAQSVMWRRMFGAVHQKNSLISAPL